jgi:hypothetical protein
LILRERLHDYGILVGMPTLRGTVLTVSRDAGRTVFWQVPG